MTGRRKTGIPSDADSEAWASRIRQVITDARKAGIDVNLDWDEDEDGIHVKLTTSTHWRDEATGVMMGGATWIVEGY